MRRLTKGILIAVGGLAALLGVAAAIVYALSQAHINKQYDLPEIVLNAPTDAMSIREGKRLWAARGCMDCHGADLAGVEFVNSPALGVFTGANLTRGAGGKGGMTDSEFALAIRHGLNKNGKALRAMPAADYQTLSDEDTGRLIAYIRSVPPVDRPSPDQKIGPLARVLFLTGKLPLLLSAELIDHSKRPKARVVPAVSREYGEYMAATCTGCHGPQLVGGPIPGAPPQWPHAQNLTQLRAKWKEADFIRAIRTGVRPDGSMIRPPMSWEALGHMTDTELKALWVYITSLPEKQTAARAP